MIKVTDDILQLIERQELSPEEESVLRRLEMLVDDRPTERQAMLRFIDELNLRNKRLSVLVVLNLDCNLACLYCYEGGLKGKHRMSGEAADKLMEFVQGKLTPAKNVLSFDFYGGEPLLSIDLIKSLSEKAGKLARSKGCTFEFSLVTNGTLLTRKVAEDLRPLGLKGAKITLDGPPRNHNRFRPFRSGKGSFKAILDNIKAVCDLVDVQVGGNYTPENFHRFPLLLDHLLKEDLTPDKVALIKFDPVVNTAGDGSQAVFRGGCFSSDEPWIAEAAPFLREEILKRGFAVPRLRPNPCVVEVTDDFTVNFDGTIYKCPGFIGHAELAVGDVWNGLSDYDRSQHQGIWKEPGCLDCVYLPLCFGGCRYMSFRREGTLGGLDCRKAFLDKTIESAIMQELRYSHNH